MPRNFNEYFGNRSVLSGVQGSSGDEYLVLRSNTVFRETQVRNKAFATIADNATPVTLGVQNTYVGVTGFTSGLATATLTFATDQYQYIGPTQIYPAMITLNASLSGATGSSYDVAIRVNDVPVAKTRVEAITNEQVVSVAAMYTLTTGDVVDIAIKDVDGTNDITVYDAQWIIDQ